MAGEMKLFSGNANKALAEEIADYLGIELGEALISTFSDGEVQVQINENVRCTDVFILQPTCAPVNDNLMEMLLYLDAFRRASSHSVSLVIPYFPYARQNPAVPARHYRTKAEQTIGWRLHVPLFHKSAGRSLSVQVERRSAACAPVGGKNGWIRIK